MIIKRSLLPASTLDAASDALVVDRVQARCAIGRLLYVSFSARTDCRVRERHFGRPRVDAARVGIEARVLGKLRRQGRDAS